MLHKKLRRAMLEAGYLFPTRPGDSSERWRCFHGLDHTTSCGCMSKELFTLQRFERYAALSVNDTGSAKLIRSAMFGL